MNLFFNNEGIAIVHGVKYFNSKRVRGVSNHLWNFWMKPADVVLKYLRAPYEMHLRQGQVLIDYIQGFEICFFLRTAFHKVKPPSRIGRPVKNYFVPGRIEPAELFSLSVRRNGPAQSQAQPKP